MNIIISRQKMFSLLYLQYTVLIFGQDQWRNWRGGNAPWQLRCGLGSLNNFIILKPLVYTNLFFCYTPQTNIKNKLC